MMNRVPVTDATGGIGRRPRRGEGSSPLWHGFAPERAREHNTFCAPLEKQCQGERLVQPQHLLAPPKGCGR